MAVYMGRGWQSAPHARVSLLSLPQDDAGEKTTIRTFIYLYSNIFRPGEGEGSVFFNLVSQSERGISSLVEYSLKYFKIS